jgi:hypothetical protein
MAVTDLPDGTQVGDHKINYAIKVDNKVKKKEYVVLVRGYDVVVCLILGYHASVILSRVGHFFDIAPDTILLPSQLLRKGPGWLPLRKKDRLLQKMNASVLFDQPHLARQPLVVSVAGKCSHSNGRKKRPQKRVTEKGSSPGVFAVVPRVPIATACLQGSRCPPVLP